MSFLKDHFKENQLFLNRTVVATIIILLLLSSLVVRIAFLQIHQHERYANLARNNQVRIIPIAPTRGLIYDRNGILLAKNVPSFSLEIFPKKAKNLKQTIQDLGNIISITPNELQFFYAQQSYKGMHDSIPIKTKLTEKEVAKFSVNKYKFPEIEVIARLSRHYTFGPEFAHTLGYIGPISTNDLKKVDLTKYRGTTHIGKNGIELYHEKLLHGTVGYQHVETDARGKIVRTLRSIPPIPGKNLYLSIDSKLQSIAYKSLKNKPGAIVAMDIKTGGILSIVSGPSYDSNMFIQGIPQSDYDQLKNSSEQPLFNRAIKGQYPPGSTVKPLVAIQALESGIIQKSTKIYDPGYYKLHEHGRKYRDWKRTGHGFMDVEHALAESCTTFFYSVSDKLGITKMHNIFSQFGLGKPTGIDLHGEASGLVPSKAWKKSVKKSAWFKGETINTGIGQGYMLVTPLQMAQVAATIANRGTSMQPYLLQSTENATKEIQNITPNCKNNVQINTPNNWNIIINGMRKTISHYKGTAHYINDPKLQIAGKTGTAQVFSLKQDEEYDADAIQKKLHDHGWFIAFAPVKNPKIAIAVLFEHEKGSAKIAKKVLDAYFKQNHQGKS